MDKTPTAMDKTRANRRTSSKSTPTATMTGSTTAAPPPQVPPTPARNATNAATSSVSSIVECSIDDIQGTAGLWSDELRPFDWSELLLHESLTNDLRHLVATPAARHQLPNLLVYGREGSGRKTRVHCLLGSLFRYQNGGNAVAAFSEARTFAIPATGGGGTGNAASVKSVDIVASLFHVELTPSDLGHRDFLVVQHCIKMFGDAPSITRFLQPVASPGSSASAPIRMDPDNPTYRVIVINHADLLHEAAQTRLRCIMEQNCRTIRFILVAEDASRIIDPVVSRCLKIRVPSPSEDDIVRVLRRALRDTGRDQQPASKSSPRVDERRLDTWLHRVAAECDGDLKRALIGLQFLCQREHRDESLVAIVEKVPRPVLHNDWIAAVHYLAELCMQPDAEMTHVVTIRRVVNELLSHCVPMHLITHALFVSLTERGADSEAQQLCLHYDRLLLDGRMPDVHLSALCLQVHATQYRRTHNLRAIASTWRPRTAVSKSLLTRTNTERLLMPRSTAARSPPTFGVEKVVSGKSREQDHPLQESHDQEWREWYKMYGNERLWSLRIPNDMVTNQ